MSVRIAPSILSANFAALGEEAPPEALRMLMLRSSVNLREAAEHRLQLAYRAQRGRFGILKLN